MKKIFILLLVIMSVGVIIFISCQKELFCEDCNANKPPIAYAGPDQTINLPIDSALLDGRASSDQDGKISEWLWSKISGPATNIITTPSDSITWVDNLLGGIYQFELKVTDNGGLYAKDTIQVIVVDPSKSNQAPVANAGPDQTIELPVNSVILDGSASTDRDNNIVHYLWIKISGPSLNIANPDSVQAQLTNFKDGTYLFELKVTDADGLSSFDTVQISVINPLCDDTNRPQVNAQLIPVGKLSMPRFGMGVSSASNKIFFAGGIINGENSSRVDIYDITSNTWSTAELSSSRFNVTAIASGNQIFFAGGNIYDDHFISYSLVDSVDIYNVATNTWTVTHLGTAGENMAAATVGNKVFFAGGNGGSNGQNREMGIDIYDLSTSTWSFASLSEPRQALSAITIHNKVYFAGGINDYSSNNNLYSRKIDIYNNETNAWSKDSLYEPKGALAGIAVHDNIYWAGGITTTGFSCVVEIRNGNTGKSSIQNLSRHWENPVSSACLKNDKIVFWRSMGELVSDNDRFDIYDITSDSWIIGVLPVHIGQADIISVNNIIYVACGYVNGVLSDKVYRLEF